MPHTLDTREITPTIQARIYKLCLLLNSLEYRIFILLYSLEFRLETRKLVKQMF